MKDFLDNAILETQTRIAQFHNEELFARGRLSAFEEMRQLVEKQGEQVSVEAMMRLFETVEKQKTNGKIAHESANPLEQLQEHA